MGRKIRKPSAAERTVDLAFMRERVPGVQYVPFKETRRLITVKPGKPIGYAELIHGSIFRIEPDPEHTDEQIAALKKMLEDNGAARVFALPRPRDKILPEMRVANVHARGMREVVTALVAESAYEDKGLLSEFLEEILVSEGL